MEPTYEVTRRSESGAPRQITCRAHEACGWSMESAGAKRDDDPIFVMQFQDHLRSFGPAGNAHGTLRKKKR